MKFAIIIAKDPDSDYTVYSPDVEAVTAVGDTPEEAVALYRDSLQHHLQFLRDRCLELPRPFTSIATDTIEVA